ncbi:MAG: RtcB family protein [Clostridiales bacterium]|nr:RtcB family protein [Clostridiales bacterium]
MLQIDGKYGSAKVFTKDVEQSAYQQIAELMNQPFVKDAHVRIMPDVHAGMGCVIGTTMRIVDKVCPNLVGVDVGCGVLVMNLPLTRDSFDAKAFDQLVRRIPAGFQVNQQPLYQEEQVQMLEELKCFDQINNIQRIYRSLGTLGGGNHFIEVAVNQEDQLYLLIHSGSRNLGTQIAKHYQNLAIAYHGAGKKKPSALPKALAYLEGAQLKDYLHDMRIAQRWAAWNREVMAQRIASSCTPPMDLSDARVFQTIHNYIDDKGILRKGAVAAHEGEMLVIPLNMRDGSIIARGLGNPDWNHSAPHGAGRLMSRGEARRSIDLKDFQRSMAGIYSSTLNKSTLDEAPMAYKDKEDILAAILDTVEVLDIIKPVYNYKSAGD